MNFDKIIDRRGTHSDKWDMMEARYGVSPDDGIAMWVADMEFNPPESVRRALRALLDHGIFGYFGDDRAYRAAITWWMQQRHGWQVAPEWIFTTHGLVNGTALTINTWTEPGDAVVLFTPVYHSFARVIRAAGREVRNCPLALRDGRYELDIDAWDAAMTGRETMLIFCSPHNPGGRVWSPSELRAVADFARRHELILVCDEIHHDLVYPGHHHTPMAVAAPEVANRLVMMSATSKTFNIAGAHTGNVIIADPTLAAAFGATMAALGLSPNAFGLHMATAAYSPEGAAWVDALMAYLAENLRIFNTGLDAIPGVHAMPLEGTYLAWVDFAGTGMAPAEVAERVERKAKIATNHGGTFGPGGESFLRFNIACPQSVIRDAVTRLHAAFSDLQ